MPPPAFDALRQFYPNEDVPKPMSPPKEEVSMEYPNTLDLRKQRAGLV